MLNEREMGENMTDKKPKDLSFGKKPPISLVPPVFITEVARCMEDGAKKRSPYNWRQSPVSAMQLLDKVLRHTLDAVNGIDITEDSKLDNLASAAADIAVYLDARANGSLVDDRPNKSKPSIELLANTTTIVTSDNDITEFLNHQYNESWACKSKKCRCNKKIDDDVGNKL